MLIKQTDKAVVSVKFLIRFRFAEILCCKVFQPALLYNNIHVH